MEPDEWEQDDELETPGAVVRSSTKKFFKMTRLTVAFILVFVVGAGGGYFLGSHGPTHVATNIPFLSGGLDATPDPNVNMTDFWEVYNALNANYVKTHASSTNPTTQDKLWGAIEGLTSSYGDPYTVFFPPVQAKAFADNISGSFGGIGMEIGAGSNNVLTVIAPLKGTPAEKAGILPGDQIMQINGTSTEGMSPDDAVTNIRGPIGTVVTLTLVRNGKQLTVPVTRATIQVPEIDYGLDQKTGVYRIALYEFTENSSDLFNTAFTAFKASGSKELIIDLRENPGGYLDDAVAIASHFLPKGSVIVTEDYDGKQANVVHTSTGISDLPAGTKVVVLIDQGSASASEILSGALQDHGVATLIGTRSFGKGSVQQVITVDGGSLKVTVARWLTPNGHWIMGNGITPNIQATTSPEQIAAGNDQQLARAIQFFARGK